MPAGLQIFDANGRLLLDGTTRCGRLSGMVWVGGADGSQPADLSGGQPFWAFMPEWLFKHISMKAPVPNVEINAGGVRWWYSADGGADYRTPIVGWLIYGVF